MIVEIFSAENFPIYGYHLLYTLVFVQQSLLLSLHIVSIPFSLPNCSDSLTLRRDFVSRTGWFHRSAVSEGETCQTRVWALSLHYICARLSVSIDVTTPLSCNVFEYDSLLSMICFWAWFAVKNNSKLCCTYVHTCTYEIHD